MSEILRTLTTGQGPSPEAFFWAHRSTADLVWLDGADRSDHLFSWGGGAPVASGAGWPERVRDALGPRRSSPRGLFAGGLIGYLAYEAGRQLEAMPTPAPGALLPEVGLRPVEGGLHYRRDERAWVAAGTRSFVEEAEARLAAVAGEPPALPAAAGQLLAPDRPLAFQRAVRRIQDWIRAGDCYQVNLARRFALGGVGEPASAYLRLRRQSPADHGAYVAVPGGAILSNSPEGFVALRAGQVVSRPIKGTRPRDGTGRDRAWAQELAADPKERAELTMIVDLVRNDLGRVCVPGSIATEPRRVYALPTVHHADQAVRGVLAPGRDAVDLLAAAFPPGSVTGAPKVRAMAILGELEPVPRGVSYGAIGWLSSGGDASLSVAIRTATFLGDTAWVHVGGGIVADSDPAREWEETRWKAAALLRALTGATPAARSAP